LKKYECLYIVNINFDSEGISAVTARVEAVLKNVGAELANSQHWGKRKLAYAIDKERYGNYILLHFQGENPNIAELHREFEIESGVLHYMTIRLDEFPDFDTLTVPQAFEADRSRRPSQYGDRKPRRYDNDENAAPAVVEKTEGVAEAAVAPESAEVVESDTDETIVAEDTAEVVEEVTEESADVEETAEEVTEEATEEVVEEAAVIEEAPEEVVEEAAVASEEVVEEPEAVEEPAEESTDEADEDEKAAGKE